MCAWKFWINRKDQGVKNHEIERTQTPFQRLIENFFLSNMINDRYFFHEVSSKHQCVPLA